VDGEGGPRGARFEGGVWWLGAHDGSGGLRGGIPVGQGLRVVCVEGEHLFGSGVNGVEVLGCMGVWYGKRALFF
jgi:hypothetical protein